jgi:colanic acid/amylovoran biosynthesis glycosyltransferase
MPAERSGPTVAHLRSELFLPTETFIHQYVQGAESVRPVLITKRRVGRRQFPFDGPVLELHRSWDPGSVARAIARRLRRRPAPDSFADPRTFRFLRRHETGVLHAHFGQDGWRALPVARETGLPLVTSFYGFDAWMLPGKDPWPERYATLFAEGRLFLAEGPAMADRLQAIGCPAGKVAVQRLAIDLDRYPFRPREATARPARVLFCGRFVEKKGLVYALKAVHRVQRDHAVELHVVGDGELRPQVEATIHRLDLHDVVTLHGMLPHQALVQQLLDADLLLQPSVVAANGDTEGGAPTTLLEAQATGLPIVATRHQDIPFVVAEGESAVLVPERDVAALTHAIDGLLRTPDRWPSMGEAGRHFVEEHHAVRPLVRQLESRYRALI